ncbi:MAG: PLP-dependent aminotransferase family protein [Caulobacteraceae bacterium]|nr:PLP-dependent aminotransferase family protein [Caulobacteraceae bacterium]
MWTPTLPAGPAPVYERLADALAADIETGALRPGDRLPPQRELAYQLKIGVGTVTRAYAEAERLGLLTSHVGRGSFVAGGSVAGPRPAPDGPIDMARSIPPPGAAEPHIAATLAHLSRLSGLAERIGYAPPGGHAEDKAMGAQWLRGLHDWPDLTADQLICCAGAQQGVAVALGVLCRPGDALIAEAATFAGLKGLAAHMDYRLVGAAMDEQGLTPEGLERAAIESGAKVAYVLPTQNPTARLMGAARRRDIAEVARGLGLWLVEDDLYGAYAGGYGLPSLTPLAALAPERVLFVSALSKAVAPGLRTGWLVLPRDSGLTERALGVLHAIALGAPSLGGLVGSSWIEDGTAQAILTANRLALEARTKLALRVLGAAVERPAMAAAPHLWLPMAELEAERVAGRALRGGVELTPPDGPILDRAAMFGLRLCLGGPPDLETLERGLTVIKAALASSAADSRTLI